MLSFLHARLASTPPAELHPSAPLALGGSLSRALPFSFRELALFAFVYLWQDLTAKLLNP